MNFSLGRVSPLLLAFALGASSVYAAPQSGLANATVLIIRHGEKPETGTGLTPAGEARAKAYIKYFQSYKVDGKPTKIDYIFATKDSKKSARETLTVTPFSKAVHLPFDARFKNNDYQGMIDALKEKPLGKTVLICWHHGNIPAIITGFGGNPKALIGADKWPDTQFGWVIQLRFDKEGKLAESKKIVEPF